MELKGIIVFRRQSAALFCYLLNHLSHIKLGRENLQPASFDLRKIQDFVDQAVKPAGSILDLGEGVFERIQAGSLGIFLQHIAVPQDDGQGCAQLMADLGQEHALGPVGGIGDLFGLGQLISQAALSLINLLIAQGQRHLVSSGLEKAEVILVKEVNLLVENAQHPQGLTIHEHRRQQRGVDHILLGRGSQPALILGNICQQQRLAIAIDPACQALLHHQGAYAAILNAQGVIAHQQGMQHHAILFHQEQAAMLCAGDIHRHIQHIAHGRLKRMIGRDLAGHPDQFFNHILAVVQVLLHGIAGSDIQEFGNGVSHPAICIAHRRGAQLKTTDFPGAARLNIIHHAALASQGAANGETLRRVGLACASLEQGAAG